jgi:hypothetical protein
VELCGGEYREEREQRRRGRRLAMLYFDKFSTTTPPVNGSPVAH